jgi:hypothetical protein
MSESNAQAFAAQARALLESAHAELLAAAKIVVGDDGQRLVVAAASVDLAVEMLMPPDSDSALAASSCRDALGEVSATRDYAAGGTIANALEPARKKLEDALALLSRQ